MDDIYIKKIYTRFNPNYVALGNFGSLVFVEEGFFHHYDMLACFKLYFKKGKISASLTVENEKYKCYVAFESAEGTLCNSIEFDSPREALDCLELLIVEQLDEHRELIKESFPDFYEKEEQLLLFE